MTNIPPRLTVSAATGRVEGPASITWNDPFPCVNGSWGSGAMMGVLMHTEDGSESGTVAWFNNPAAQASAHFAIGTDGAIHQFGPIGKSWEAWHAAGANAAWYGIEHEDDGNPGSPLTAAQVTASARLVECLSAFAGFPLQVSDSPSVKGYGIHSMGGQEWGGHLQCPGDVRAAQRRAIIALAAQIRNGASDHISVWQLEVSHPADNPVHGAVVVWQHTGGVAQWEVFISGPRFASVASTVSKPQAVFSGLAADATYTVRVTSLVDGKPAGVTGIKTFRTQA